jgi:hypothetical protein
MRRKNNIGHWVTQKAGCKEYAESLGLRVVEVIEEAGAPRSRAFALILTE